MLSARPLLDFWTLTPANMVSDFAFFFFLLLFEPGLKMQMSASSGGEVD